MITRDEYNELMEEFQVLKGVTYEAPQLEAVFSRLNRDGFDPRRLKAALDYVAAHQELRYKDIYGAILTARENMKHDYFGSAGPVPVRYSIDREGQVLAKLYVDFINWLMARYQGTRYMEIFKWFNDNYWMPFCEQPHDVLKGKITEAWKQLATPSPRPAGAA